MPNGTPGGAPRWEVRAVRSDGHAAAPGAAQFAPFAALRGLEELIDGCARRTLDEPWHELTPEECEAMSATLLSLRKGDQVRCVVHDGHRYREVLGTVGQIEPHLRRMQVGGRWVCLDALGSIELA